MSIYYTATNIFTKGSRLKRQYDDYSWSDYIEHSGLTHCVEIVSDGLLNGLAFETDLSDEYWDNVVATEEHLTDHFRSLDYVLKETKHLNSFNLLAVIPNPPPKKAMLADEFEFMGYDIIDDQTSISILLNCGYFEEFSQYQNKYGLVDQYSKVQEIYAELKEESAADPHIFASQIYEIWRHKIIGQKGL